MESSTLNELSTVLQNIGMSAKESTVYIAALRSGTAAASVIAETSGINRVTVYELLKKMVQSGLARESESSGVLHFTVLNPDEFIAKQKSYIDQLVSKKKDFLGLMSEKDTKPHVRFLHGLEGIKKGYQETLKEDLEILSIANSQNIREHWPEYDKEYVAKRAAKKIFLRGIAPEDSSGIQVHKEDDKYFREMRLLKKSLLPPEMLENEICIFGDTLLIASFEPDLFAIIITSPAVTQTQRQLFQILWNIAKSE